MSEAYMVRGGERQELLREIQRKLRLKIDDFDRQIDEVYLLIVSQLVMILSDWSKGAASSLSLEGDALPTWNGWRMATCMSNVCDDLVNLWLAEARDAIMSFARSEAEQRELVARLTRELLNSATNRFGNDLRRDELDHPSIIFHAPSAMSDVIEDLSAPSADSSPS